MSLTKSQLTLIGEITTEFSKLEMMICVFISGFISSDVNVGHIITSNLAFNRLTELLRQLLYYKIRDKKLQAEFETLFKKLTEVNKKRNEIIHSNFSEVIDAVSQRKVKGVFRTKLNTKKLSQVIFHVEEINNAELKRILKQIIDCNAGIMKFMFKLRDNKRLKMKVTSLEQAIKEYNKAIIIA